MTSKRAASWSSCGGIPRRSRRTCCWCRITAAEPRRPPAFIATVAPEIAVYTPGYRNRFGHPRPEVVARYDRAGVRGYRTDYDGALTFTFAPGSPRAPRAERADDRRYWREAPVRGEATPLD